MKDMTKHANCPECHRPCHELGNRLHLQKLLGHRTFGRISWPVLARVVQHGKDLHFSITVNGYELTHIAFGTWRELGTSYETASLSSVCLPGQPPQPVATPPRSP